MVRNYVKKLPDVKYSETDIKKAIETMKTDKITIKEAAIKFGIPYHTLYCRVIGKRGQKRTGRGTITVFTSQEETELADGIKTMEKWGFGLSRKEVLKIVQKYVIENDIKTPFNHRMPGEDWFRNFKERNRLSLKKAQSVEFSRRKALDPFLIYGYFDTLEECFEKMQYSPENVWNLDETSVCTDPSKTKVLGEKNAACSRTIGGSGKENMTVLFACNAAGGKAPPMIIFRGINVWDEWMADSKLEFPNTVYAATKKGWIQTCFRKFYDQAFYSADIKF